MEYKIFWGGGLILLGIFLAFFGNTLATVMFVIMSTLATFCAVFWLVFWIFDLTDYAPTEVVGWVVFGISFAIGGVVGYFFAKHRPLGLALIACCGGVALGFLLNVTFLIDKAWIYYLVIVGCAIVLGVVTYFLQDTVIIFITAFMGSYGIIRGISLYAGGFPSEMELHDDIQAGTIDWESFPKEFYAYLAGIVILTILSSFY